jgi:hypothetical protein
LLELSCEEIWKDLSRSDVFAATLKVAVASYFSQRKNHISANMLALFDDKTVAPCFVDKPVVEAILYLSEVSRSFFCVIFVDASIFPG